MLKIQEALFIRTLRVEHSDVDVDKYSRLGE